MIDTCLANFNLKPMNYCCHLVSHLCLTLCDPMDYSTPGSSVHGISQARILEYSDQSRILKPFPSPGDLPNPGIEPTSPVLVGGFFTTEPSGKPQCQCIIYLVLLMKKAEQCPTAQGQRAEWWKTQNRESQFST